MADLKGIPSKCLSLEVVHADHQTPEKQMLLSYVVVLWVGRQGGQVPQVFCFMLAGEGDIFETGLVLSCKGRDGTFPMYYVKHQKKAKPLFLNYYECKPLTAFA